MYVYVCIYIYIYYNVYLAFVRCRQMQSGVRQILSFVVCQIFASLLDAMSGSSVKGSL